MGCLKQTINVRVKGVDAINHKIFMLIPKDHLHFLHNDGFMKTKIVQYLVSIVALMIITTLTYAADPNRVFNLTLINHTDETLIVHSIQASSGVTIKPDQKLWTPGATLHIECENVSSNGVFGYVYFLDGKKHIARLMVEVREQRHHGQPIFGIHNQYYNSTVLSKTRNPNINGRFLMYTAATIELQKNQ